MSEVGDELKRAIWEYGTPEEIVNHVQRMRAQEAVDIGAREEAMRLCPECRRGDHREPPNGSPTCRCGDLRCNCITAGKPLDWNPLLDTPSNPGSPRA